jgi:hypothetical protein
MWIVEKMLPLSVTEGDHARIFLETACIPEMNKRITNKRIIHVLIEIFVALKRQVGYLIQVAIGRYRNLPVLHLSVDIWWCHVMEKKFLGVRICYVSEGKPKSHLLSVRLLKISSEERENSPVFANILGRWTTQVLEDFDLNSNDFLSATTDCGGDVKKMCSDRMIFNLHWEWCLPHTFNRALKHSFGIVLTKRRDGDQGI